MRLKKILKIEHWEVITLFLIVYDFLAILFSYLAALWIRFDVQFSKIDPRYLQGYYRTILFYAIFCVIVFWAMKLYRSIWRFASYIELIRVFFATLITGVAYFLIVSLFVLRMPISYYIMGIVFQFILVLGIRFSYRFVLLLKKDRFQSQTNRETIMIIGAGEAGKMILRDLQGSKNPTGKVCCFIDDNKNKWGRYIDNVPVFGGRDRILEAVSKFKVQKIYIAIPSASAKEKRDILQVCNETSCEMMSLPGLYQLYTGEVSVSKMKPVQIEDLLGREPIAINLQEVYEQIRDKVILITGVGSIGSELARQIASHFPKHLILFDIYENNAYDVQQELKAKFPNLRVDTIIGSVRDSRKTMQVFEQYKPEIVYHAAAHKHVPLMEDSPCEAIKNNAIGTYKTAFAALVHGCKKFVLISTDKAVNPTNIMGASKRLCEMIVQSFDSKVKEGAAYEIPQLAVHSSHETIAPPETIEALKTARTEFAAVRFGNVLGSSGSVIPLFKKQIEAGGPVTVTHPEIIRYFMTIPEAVSLVLLAGTYAKGGEIFVLDMGEPVKIDTLARNLIKLSGHTPDVDIKLEYTGLRSGEKLYEEKLMAEEGLKKTPNDLIHIGCPIPFDFEVFLHQLDELLEAAYNNKPDIRDIVKRVVSTYHPA